MSKHTLLAVCLLVGTALSCSSNGGSGKAPGAGGDDSGTSGPDSSGGGKGNGDSEGEGATSTYTQVSDVTKLIYDALEAGEDVSPHIQAVLEAFQVPVLDPEDEEGATARIEAGLPFVTTQVVMEMADAYASGRLVDAKGFCEGLVEQGVTLAFPYNLNGMPLDSTFLGTMIYAYAATAESEPDMPIDSGYVLPALVRELGQERARRLDPKKVDPAWGDGRLDPLQFTLLSFTIFAKPATSATAKSLPQDSAPKFGFKALTPGAFIKEKLTDAVKDGVKSGVQDFVEVPLGEEDAAKVSVCGSLILYGHKVTVTNTPDLLWHAPKAPNITTVEMTLTFEDDYYDNWARAVLGGAVTDLTGCKFPRKGPIEGKSVEWSVSDALEEHGSYDVTGTTTNDLGKATASWRTITDNTPPACQTFEHQRDAVGATEAVVSGLLPGWSTVETIVTFLNPETGTQGNDPLTVLYYDITVDDTCHAE